MASIGSGDIYMPDAFNGGNDETSSGKRFCGSWRAQIFAYVRLIGPTYLSISDYMYPAAAVNQNRFIVDRVA
jgi:hypothetical protein